MSIQAAGYDKDFEQLFKTYFKQLHTYAYKFLQNEVIAEDIVQQVFVKLWEQKDRSRIDDLNAYLHKAVYNGCINDIKKHKLRSGYMSSMHTDTAENNITRPERKELEQRLHNAICELPKQCRLIFQLSRFEDLKYKEIANRLDLSVKTVEAQMSKALKMLREKMSDLLMIIIITILTLF